MIEYEYKDGSRTITAGEVGGGARFFPLRHRTVQNGSETQTELGALSHGIKRKSQSCFEVNYAWIYTHPALALSTFVSRLFSSTPLDTFAGFLFSAFLFLRPIALWLVYPHLFKTFFSYWNITFYLRLFLFTSTSSGTQLRRKTGSGYT